MRYKPTHFKPRLWEDYEKKILVIGLHFSGTSVICSHLGAHPDVAIISEIGGGAERRILGKKIVGVKLIVPHQISSMKMILKRYKGYKVVVITRNKRDLIEKWMRSTINSHPQWYWQMFWKVFDFLGLRRRTCLAIIDYGNRFLSKAFGSFYIMVSYEQYLEDKETVLKQLCSDLGVSFHNKMLTGNKMNFAYYHAEKWKE